MSKPRIAIVGCGYWGQNLARNFAELKEVEVRAVCDFDMNALARMKRRYPAILLLNEYRDVLADGRIDAVVLATPLATHYPFAREALRAGKHVLVEKPMTARSSQALDLIELADRHKKVLMVDHTFVYTGAVRAVKSLVDAGQLGELLYFDAVRISLGLVQSDVNVLWDLAPHDFSIFNYLCSADPVSITATGAKHLDCSFENIAYVSAAFENNLQAHFHFNWLAPVKVRRTLIGGAKKMIVYDDMEASEKVKVYGKGLNISHDPEHRERLLTGFQNGDMTAPNLDTGEALRCMAREFVGAIIENRLPLSDGLAGYRVVRMLEMAQASMLSNGRPIEAPRRTIPIPITPFPRAEVGA